MEAHGNGGVLARQAVEGQGNGSVVAKRRQWKDKATAVLYLPELRVHHPALSVRTKGFEPAAGSGRDKQGHYV